MMPEEIIGEMLSVITHIPLMDEQIRSIVKNAVEAGYAAGCEQSALIVETKSVPLGHERRYFAKAIREWCKQVIV